MSAPSRATSAACSAAYGHVVALRRTRVGPFFEAESAPLGGPARGARSRRARICSRWRPGLSELPCIVLDRNGAARLRRGQSVILRGREAPAEGPAYAVCAGMPIAFGRVEAASSCRTGSLICRFEGPQVPFPASGETVSERAAPGMVALTDVPRVKRAPPSPLHKQSGKPPLPGRPTPQPAVRRLRDIDGAPR